MVKINTEDDAERLFWEFKARSDSTQTDAPMSERDSFKCAVRPLLRKLQEAQEERQLWRDVILDALKMLDGTIWYQKHRAIIEMLRHTIR